MKQEEAKAKAVELLKQAGALREQAWAMLSAVASEEDIEDALEVSVDMSVNELRETLLDDAGWKTYALLDHWRMLEEEAAEEAKEADNGANT